MNCDGWEWGGDRFALLVECVGGEQCKILSIFTGEWDVFVGAPLCSGEGLVEWPE